MKNQFLLAFNEIVKEKNLPPETVIDALKTALVSAYRRNNAISASQGVEAEIDHRTGEVTVYAEKEVTEDLFDARTEVVIEEAKLIKPDVELGDLIMVDSTPKDFGRIAAQTAKQVILQRVREAERDHLYDEFSGREGELVNGTVQSMSGGSLTIGLGRTEALLPRGQQVPGERYRAHDKIRVFILEVRKSSRGPQILVSRSHRNLLRRLLELEVPEIYNGQVDIKSIARESGARSKVAVKAMQPGVDPVGACVGMRGVRIQSIVRELNDEKIDVIEWDQDPINFIGKALSPARVSQVFLDDDPVGGRTATVVVPDDQLSLAIGREGQNARLAAKLTGWRIDIKSLTEAGRDSFELIDNEACNPEIVKDFDLHARVLEVIEKKEAGRPITAEDYNYINKFVAGVEGRVIAARQPEHEQTRRHQYEARESVPDGYWNLQLEELNLPLSIHRMLEVEYETVGALMFQIKMDLSRLLALDGFTDESLDKVKARMEELEMPEPTEEELTEIAKARAERLAKLEAERLAKAEAQAVAVAKSEASFGEAIDRADRLAEARREAELDMPAVDPEPMSAEELEALQGLDLSSILAIGAEEMAAFEEALQTDEDLSDLSESLAEEKSDENESRIKIRRIPATGDDDGKKKGRKKRR